MRDDDADGGTYVEIPGEQTLLKTTGIAPIRVKLPLEGGADEGGSVSGILASVIMLAGSLGFAAFLASLQGFGWATVAIALFGGGLGAIMLMGELSSRIPAGERGGPLYFVSSGGVWDRRASADPVAWNNIRRADVVYSRQGLYSAVRLRLREPVAAPGKARKKAWFQSRETSDLTLPLHFNVEARSAALAITEMVRRHGGEVRT